MSAEYYTLVTDVGHAKLTNALALGQVVTLTNFAVGDGNGLVYNPVAAQTALAREVYRAPINAIRPDAVNPTWLTVEAVIPASVGGWTVREAGIFDVDGDLIAIAKYPESVKPALDSGVGKDLYCRVILQHGNVSTVTLKIDPAVVLATRSYVTDTVAAGIAAHAAAAGAHPDASTTTKGFVELATVTEAKTGTDTARAVTPAGLKAALAEITVPAATEEVAGIVRLATAAEVAAGAAADVAVSPAHLGTLGRKPGEVFWTAAATPPSGGLKANGAAVSRETYAALFAAIGTTFGEGDGETTFTLPNLVNAMPLGAGGLYPLGATGGETAHTLSVAEMPAHTHYVANADTGGNASLSASTSMTKIVSGSYGLGGTATVPIIGVSSPSGSGAAHNNLPPFAALLPCIQY